MALRPASRTSSRSSGFVYKPRSTDQLKSRAERKSGRFDSIYKAGQDSFRAKVGDNLIRFLPPTWDDHDHYGYTIWVHRNVGADSSTYLCPRKMLQQACPVCDAAKEAKDAGEAEEAKELAPSERVVFWILDRDADDPDKPILYDMSWTQDRDIVALCVNERTGEILLVDNPNKGYDVSFKRHGTGMKTKYSAWAIARDDSPVHDDEKIQEEILEFIMANPVPDMLNFYDAEYLERTLSGVQPAKDEDLDEVKDTGGSRTGRHSNVEPPFEEASRNARPAARQVARRAPVVEEVDDEIVDEPTQPRRNRVEPARNARAQVDEEVDEENELPDERPAQRGARDVRRGPPPDEENEESYQATNGRGAAPSRASNARPSSRNQVVDEEDEEVPPQREISRNPDRRQPRR